MGLKNLGTVLFEKSYLCQPFIQTIIVIVVSDEADMERGVGNLTG